MGSKLFIKSPRRQARLAGLAILLAAVILFLGAAYVIIFPYTVEWGCGPHFESERTGTISGMLTASTPERSEELGSINYIVISYFQTENQTPVTILISDSNANVYLNATHPTQINLNNSSIALEARFFPYFDEFLTLALTIQRITNDTAYTLHYTVYFVSYICIDPVPPYGFYMLGIIVGIILIVYAFRTLDRIALQAQY